MMYCERCQLLSESVCQHCKGALREPRPNDPVLLEKADPIRTAIIESVLEGEGIPFSKIGRMGAALSMQTGGMLEEYSIFVPFGAWERASALTALDEAGAEGEEVTILDGVDDELLFEEEEEEDEDEDDEILDEEDMDEEYDHEDPDMD